MDYFDSENLPQVPRTPPVAPTKPFFPSKKAELLFGAGILVIGCFLCNCLFYGGLNLGFALFFWASLLCTTAYLLVRGAKPTGYSMTLLISCLVITASFARSDDGVVKFFLLCLTLFCTNLVLCLLAGQNRRNPRGFLCTLDVPRTVFMLGFGHLSPAFRGLKQAVREKGTAGKNFSAVALGLLISVPLLAIVIPLLIKADAAFDGLLQTLPDWDLTELVVSLLFGSLLACYLYSRGTALRHAPKSEPDTKIRKGMNALTVNTVLVAVGVVYLAYLISQLAYFSGGFSGILPEEYTVAEYARRGFFEMAWICAINLGVIALGVGLTAVSGRSPLLTRLLCLFVGIVTLFLVTSASAKMFMYIDAYGLSRLRVLTEAIMIWLGLSTLIVCLWLFLPKLAYMKIILVFALVIGAVLGWADVDAVVAKYNVDAYLSGKLQTVDVGYLACLGDGTTPYLLQLTQVEDEEIAQTASNYLDSRRQYPSVEDIRDWNFADHQSDSLLKH